MCSAFPLDSAGLTPFDGRDTFKLATPEVLKPRTNPFGEVRESSVEVPRALARLLHAHPAGRVGPDAESPRCEATRDGEIEAERA